MSWEETDPIFISHIVATITSENITNWNTVFWWWNHALMWYLTWWALDNYYTKIEIDWLLAWVGWRKSITKTSQDYVVVEDDNVVLVTWNYIIELPTAENNTGKEITIKNIWRWDVFISTTWGQTIDSLTPNRDVYITSNGIDNYINTNIKPTVNTVVTIVWSFFCPNEWLYYMWAWWASWKYYYFWVINGKRAARFWNKVINSTDDYDTNEHTFVFDKNGLSVDGVLKADVAGYTFSNPWTPIYLFKNNLATPYPVSFKLKSVVISTSWVVNFSWTVKWNGSIYDTVTSTYFSNATWSPLPITSQWLFNNYTKTYISDGSNWYVTSSYKQ